MLNPDNPSARGGHRYWMPLVAMGLAAVGIVMVHQQAELEGMFRLWLTLGVILLALVLVLIWFCFLSRFRWQARLLGVGLVVVMGFGLTWILRIEGSASGSGLPKLVWRWAPPKLGQIDRQAVSPALSPGKEPAGEGPIPMAVPQFLGANRDGIMRGMTMATNWMARPPKLLWRQPIGLGWSAFAVVDGSALTQEQRGEGELVTCYEVRTGRLRWAHTNRVRFSHWQAGAGPHATPTVIEGRVYAYGATGQLDCLEAGDGRRVWSRDVLVENGLPNLTWGTSCSPLVVDDLVVVTGGQTNGPTVLAYDRPTGDFRWRAGTSKASYASPLLATLADERVILSVNAGTLTAHDPATGTERLNYRWADDRTPIATQPVVLGGDRVLLSAGYGIGCVMLQVKAGTNGLLNATPVWKAKTMKTQFNSTTARDGFLYGLDDGRLACIDLATGQRKWKENRYGSGQTLLVGDVILIQSEPGEVYLAKASPDAFAEVASLPALSSKTWNYPTLAGRYLLVRNDLEAACYELAQ